MSVGALVLAAGRGRRMGGEKLTAVLAGRPILRHVVDRILAAGLPPPVVVLGHRADAVGSVLDGLGCRTVVAADHEAGLSRSLRQGIASLDPSLDGVIVCLGDMPFVPVSLLRTMAAIEDRAAVAAPLHANGRLGNPVLWGSNWFDRLAALEGDAGAGRLLRTLGPELTTIPCDDDGVLIDIDTPGALAEARQRLTEI